MDYRSLDYQDIYTNSSDLALWGAFVDGLIDNDAKVASSKKHTKFKTRVQNTYPIYYQNGQARYANLLPKFGTAHTYMTRRRENSSPGPWA